MENTESLEQLVYRLLSAKQAENNARESRIIIEEKIANLIPGPERGQKTIVLDNGIKITVERGFNYKADLTAIENTLETEINPPPIRIKTIRELDEKGYEWYRKERPRIFDLISKFVEVKPKKIAVTVKTKE